MGCSVAYVNIVSDIFSMAGTIVPAGAEWFRGDGGWVFWICALGTMIRSQKH